MSYIQFQENCFQYPSCYDLNDHNVGCADFPRLLEFESVTTQNSSECMAPRRSQGRACMRIRPRVSNGNQEIDIIWFHLCILNLSAWCFSIPRGPFFYCNKLGFWIATYSSVLDRGLHWIFEAVNTESNIKRLRTIAVMSSTLNPSQKVKWSCVFDREYCGPFRMGERETTKCKQHEIFLHFCEPVEKWRHF